MFSANNQGMVYNATPLHTLAGYKKLRALRSKLKQNFTKSLILMCQKSPGNLYIVHCTASDCTSVQDIGNCKLLGAQGAGAMNCAFQRRTFLSYKSYVVKGGR